MACMGRPGGHRPETEYLKALGAAEHSEVKDPTLLIYAEDYEKPLRFTRPQ